MAKFNVVDMNGQHVSEIELSDAVFGITPNEKAVHIAVVNFLANQRQGTQNTKIRMEVSGGGKKPWRQKGTGHARQGSIRAPQWTHGGVALGPKPRSYNYHINNKVKRLALLSVLSDKAANGNMVVVDKFACDEYKTKAVVAMLNAVGAGKKNLLVNETVDAKFVKSAGNIAGVKTTFAGSVNTYDVLKADVFAEGDKVDVVGVSKGKGYQGVIKRYGQHRLRESHGTGPVARHAGSNGSTSTPARVFPGKRLPGHMGFVRVTVQNLTVVKVDTENNLIAVKGAVPGSKGTIVTLANSVKA